MKRSKTKGSLSIPVGDFGNNELKKHAPEEEEDRSRPLFPSRGRGYQNKGWNNQVTSPLSKDRYFEGIYSRYKPASRYINGFQNRQRGSGSGRGGRKFKKKVGFGKSSSTPSFSSMRTNKNTVPKWNRRGTSKVSVRSIKKDNEKLRNCVGKMRASGKLSEAEQILQSCQVTEFLEWKMLVELGEVARKDMCLQREDRLKKARKYFQKAKACKPNQSWFWIKYSQMEADIGEKPVLLRVLLEGIEGFPMCERLYIILMRFYLESNRVDLARGVLMNYKQRIVENPEKFLGVLLESASLEIAEGNVGDAREVLEFVTREAGMKERGWGERIDLELRLGRIEEAYSVLISALEACPRSLNLILAGLRILEAAAVTDDKSKSIYDRVRILLEMVKSKKFPKNGHQKVLGYAAHVFEALGLCQLSRETLGKAIELDRSSGSVWKLWVCGAISEARWNRAGVAHITLQEALEVVPERSQSVVYVTLAKIAEMDGKYSEARRLLQQAVSGDFDWKIFLERVRFELRQGEMENAVALVDQGVTSFPYVGLFWALHIRLAPPEKRMDLFKTALLKAPKSGEVWTEGARLRLNPLSPYYNLEKAKLYLSFAIKLTPDYADSFVELMKAETLISGIPLYLRKTYVEVLAAQMKPNRGDLFFSCRKYRGESNVLVLERARDKIVDHLREESEVYQRTMSVKDKSKLTKFTSGTFDDFSRSFSIPSHTYKTFNGIFESEKSFSEKLIT